MRYEIVIQSRGIEHVVKTGIRRENGAIAERDIAADSEYRNKLKRADGDPNAYAIRGAVEGDPRAEAIVYFETAYPYAFIDTIVRYRPVGGDPIPDTLEDDLLASLYALDTGATL